MKVKRALISVSDKTGVVELGKALADLGIEIISTGGTMRTLKEAGVPVIAVQDVTGFPEMMDGRVKTLNPKIHGAILAVRDNPEHVKAMKEHGIKPIDLVVVNLYPFQQTIAKPDVTLQKPLKTSTSAAPAWSVLRPRTINTLLSSPIRLNTAKSFPSSRRTANFPTSTAWNWLRKLSIIRLSMIRPLPHT